MLISLVVCEKNDLAGYVGVFDNAFYNLLPTLVHERNTIIDIHFVYN